MGGWEDGEASARRRREWEYEGFKEEKRSQWQQELKSVVTSTTIIPIDPVFLPTANNITVREGGKAELPCSVQYLSTKKVAWRRVDQDEFLTIAEMTWVADPAFSVRKEVKKHDISDWYLVITNVTPKHAGLYECQITASAGYFKHVQLNVVGPPITAPAISLYGTDFVERGEKILLICNATGGTQIAEDIDWFKDGNIIDTSRRRRNDVMILKYRSLEEGALISRLQIDHADMDDAGTYVCRSSYNKLGDFSVNVLAADSNNVKRGTQSSNNTACSPVRFETRILRLLLCCWLLLYRPWR
ncbi:zwei Ig domain protein zig-8-like isoform X2 [Pomacea canaliculata]|uniref:zwei Ig domain protein zig-8-like isoform X2 n=1 Tax=Pomacea canaliculata TaxID=400727 RepID=UPI000D72A218|nr:zwei Ig domain protein zig-8-like isoform X2 [Pomacea canaliculata]